MNVDEIGSDCCRLSGSFRFPATHQVILAVPHDACILPAQQDPTLSMLGTIISFVPRPTISGGTESFQGSALQTGLYTSMRMSSTSFRKLRSFCLAASQAWRMCICQSLTFWAMETQAFC